MIKNASVVLEHYTHIPQSISRVENLESMKYSRLYFELMKVDEGSSF